MEPEWSRYLAETKNQLNKRKFFWSPNKSTRLDGKQPWNVFQEVGREVNCVPHRSRQLVEENKSLWGEKSQKSENFPLGGREQKGESMCAENAQELLRSLPTLTEDDLSTSKPLSHLKKLLQLLRIQYKLTKKVCCEYVNGTDWQMVYSWEWKEYHLINFMMWIISVKVCSNVEMIPGNPDPRTYWEHEIKETVDN